MKFKLIYPKWEKLDRQTRFILPPVVNLTNPLLPFAFVTGEKKELEINNTVLAGISFGGTYSYLIFKK